MLRRSEDCSPRRGTSPFSCLETPQNNGVWIRAPKGPRLDFPSPLPDTHVWLVRNTCTTRVGNVANGQFVLRLVTDPQTKSCFQHNPAVASIRHRHGMCRTPPGVCPQRSIVHAVGTSAVLGARQCKASNDQTDQKRRKRPNGIAPNNNCSHHRRVNFQSNCWVTMNFRKQLRPPPRPPDWWSQWFPMSCIFSPNSKWSPMVIFRDWWPHLLFEGSNLG